jgi:hypothetical protein
MIQLLKALTLISYVLLELSTLCRWKETCDIECWGLRHRLSEYSFFLPFSGLELFWWKVTFFHSLVRIPCQTSDLHCITFNWRPRHDKLKTYCKSVTELLLLDCLTLLKNSLKWLAEEMIQLLTALNLIRHILIELSTICRWKETCDNDCWGLRHQLSEYLFIYFTR